MPQPAALTMARRKMYDPAFQEEASEIISDDEAPKVFVKRCFIEELCTCE